MLRFELGGRSYDILRSGVKRGAEMHITVPSQVKEGDPRLPELRAQLHKRDQDFQKKMDVSVRAFDPFYGSIGDFDFTDVAETIRGFTVDEMAQMFGYDQGQKAVIDALLLERVSQPLVAMWKEEVRPEQREQARAFHVGYVAGQIERHLSFMKDSENDPIALKVARAKLQYVVDITLQLLDKGKPASFETKKSYLKERLEELFPKEQDDINFAMDFVNAEKWILNDFNDKNEIVVKKNQAGIHATRALVDFARQMYPDKDELQVLVALDNLVNLSDQALEDIATVKDPKRKDALIDAQIIHFAVRSANYAWAFSVIPEGLLEQRQVVLDATPGESEETRRTLLAEWQFKNPKKGVRRYTNNPKFSTFDNMSDAKGWPMVLLDMDQIRTGIRILRAEYNTKLSNK